MKGKELVTEIIDFSGITIGWANHIFQEMKKTNKYPGLKAKLLGSNKIEIRYWVKL